MLSPQPATVSGERAVRADDPVARNDDGDLVCSVRAGHCSGSGRLLHLVRDLRVAPRGSGRNGLQRIPYLAGKSGSVTRNRRFERRRPAVEIVAKLFLDAVDRRQAAEGVGSAGLRPQAPELVRTGPPIAVLANIPC